MVDKVRNREASEAAGDEEGTPDLEISVKAFGRAPNPNAENDIVSLAKRFESLLISEVSPSIGSPSSASSTWCSCQVLGHRRPSATSRKR
jgi:hypothetical protein